MAEKASQTIRGINVVIGAETKALTAALSDVDKSAKDIESELKKVERLLKFDPKNTELLAQKQKLLADRVHVTQERLNRLRSVQDQVNKLFAEGKINEAQYRDFQRQIIESTNKLQTFEKQLKSTRDRSKELGDSLGKISDQLNKAAKAFAPLSAAGAAVSGALVGAAVKAGQLSDELHTLSAQTGLSLETLQKFQYASDLIDVSMETLSGSLSRLTRNMDNARRGNAQTQEAFDQLGISITDANGTLRNSEEVFYEVIEALGNIQDYTERDAIAMKIFGRSAQELNPLVLGGAEALKQLGEEAKAAGLIMSDEAMAQVLEFNDEIDKLKATARTTWTELGITVSRVLLPAFQQLSAKLKDVMAWVRNLDEGTIKIILTIAGVLAAITPLLMILTKITVGVQSLISLFGALTSPVGLVVVAIAGLVTAGILLIRNWEKVKEFFLGVWDAIVYGVQQAVSYVKTMVLSFAKAVLDGVSMIAKYIPGLNDSIDSARQTLQDLIDTEKETIQYRREARQEALEEARALREAEKDAELLKNQTAELTAETKNLTTATKGLTEAEKKLQEERDKLNAEWQEKLFRQTATKLELLAKEEEAAIEQAKKVGADISAIEEYYRREREKLQEEEQKKKEEFADQWRQKLLQQQQAMTKNEEEQIAIRLELLRLERDRAIKAAEEQKQDTAQIRDYYEKEEARIVEEYAQKKRDARAAYEKEWNQKLLEMAGDRMALLEMEAKEAIEKARELEMETTRIVEYYEQKKRELRRQTLMDYLSTTQDILGRIGELFSLSFDNREQELENWYEEQKKAIEANITDEEERTTALQELDEEREKKQREIARQKAAQEKAASLFSIAINTARAIVEALPNLVLAAVVGAMGAAQAALVASKPLPALAKGAKVTGPTVALIGEGGDDEAVLPLNQKVFAEIGRGIAENLPQQQGQGPRLEFHFHIGQMIGDERGMRKLAEKVFSYEYSIKQRLGEVGT